MIDEQGIPFSAFREVLTVLPRGHSVRVPLLFLALTGCRIRELSNFDAAHLQGNVLYWRLGKNQKGWRRESLPLWFLEELDLYRKTYRVPMGKLVHCTGGSLTRRFNKEVRPLLGPDWNIKRAGPFSQGGFVLQVKGFRKSYATTIFYREFQKWNDAGAALEMASAKLQHSTKNMTSRHYIKELEYIEVEAWDRFLKNEVRLEEQRHLVEWQALKTPVETSSRGVA